jgi:hypothetical protein
VYFDFSDYSEVEFFFSNTFVRAVDKKRKHSFFLGFVVQKPDAGLSKLALPFLKLLGEHTRERARNFSGHGSPQGCSAHSKRSKIRALVMEWQGEEHEVAVGSKVPMLLDTG